ncbi:MAG: hypothetical protein WCT18_03885 [Patescibacteria group bacterium]
MPSNRQIIKKTVTQMGGKIEKFIPERNCFYIKFKNKKILYKTDFAITSESHISGQFTKCKDITSKLLLGAKLPTPKTESFYSSTYNKYNAKKDLAKLIYPIILKDATGSNSRGIFPFITDLKEAVSVLARELPYYHSMVAQEMVFGKEYRVLVLGEKILAVLEMIPPAVIGDGLLAIKQLIEKKQNKTKKRTDLNKKLEQILADQGVNLKTVLPKGQKINFKKNSCLAEGGETRDVTEQINEKIKKICITASKTVGRNLSGIDIICQDIAKKPKVGQFFIIEINNSPDLSIHYHPTFGQKREVAREIIKFIFQKKSPRI